MTILTDAEMPPLPQKVFLDNAQHHGWGYADYSLKDYAKAVEAAIKEKLQKKMRIGYISEEDYFSLRRQHAADWPLNVKIWPSSKIGRIEICVAFLPSDAEAPTQTKEQA